MHARYGTMLRRFCVSPPRHGAKRGRLIGSDDLAKSFEEVAREWHALQNERWKPVHANDAIISLESDAFPDNGAILRKIESRSVIETARRIKQRVAAIYRYANAEDAKIENPAAISTIR